jgi:Zn-dependent protease
MKIKLRWSLLTGVILFGLLYSTYGLYFILSGFIQSAFTLFGFGLALSVGMYLSILSHECGHSLIAWYYGLKVDYIELWGMGGFTHVEDNNESFIWVMRSSSGVYVNFMLALVLFIISFFTSGLWSCFLDSLGGMNIVLAVSNLLPFKYKGYGTDGLNLITNLWKLVKE